MEKHPDPETLSDFSRLALERQRLRRTAWHLSRCQSCRRALARLSPEGLSVLGGMLNRAGLVTESESPRTVPENEPTSYGSIFDRVRQKVAAGARDLVEDRRKAPKHLVELLAAAPDEREALVISRPEFRSRAIAELLLTRSRSPPEAHVEDVESRALLALRVLEAVRGDLPADDPALATSLEDLEAEAWGLIGNARRIHSDLRGADRALSRAWETLDRGTGDPLAWAQVASFEASVRRSQRRFDEALSLLNRAVQIFQRAGDVQAESRARVNLGLTMSYQGDSRGAIDHLEAARQLADFERDGRLELTIEQNLLYCLKDEGRFEEALCLLPRVRRLSERVNRSLDRLDLDWLEGQLHVDLGRRVEAEKLLDGARRGFVRLGVGYSAALVSLDLASLLLEEGRDAEVRRLANESLPIFLSRDVPAEAAAALALFRQAALAERATVEMARKVTELLGPVRTRGRSNSDP